MSSQAAQLQPNKAKGCCGGRADQQRLLIESAEKSLKSGLVLKKWWEQVDADNSYADSYRESFVFHRPDDESFGFFDEVPFEDGRRLKVIGNVQQMFYDQPKTPGSQEKAALWMQKQMREFVLRYFMRVSDFREPQPYPEEGQRPLPPVLRFFSRCPRDEFQTQGFGYSQAFYKLRQDGRTGRFPEHDKDAIVDLRELHDQYEWIVVSNPIFDFGFDFQPLGLSGPRIHLPVPASNYLILSRDLITDQENPEPGVLGRYGIGYAFVRDPGPAGFFAYGPGQLEPAIQLIIWEVRESGKVIVRMTFVSSSPERLINISLNPMMWGMDAANAVSFGAMSGMLSPLRDAMEQMPFSRSYFDPILGSVSLANLLSGGRAGRDYCISKRHIDKELLLIHFRQHYNAVLGSLETWRQIADWCDIEKLPKWVVRGTSA